MSTPRRAGQHAGLTKALVVAAAREIADDEGLERLTLRRLASRLGVMPNALYAHIADKEALLDAVLDSLLGDIDTAGVESLDWREGLRLIMDASRRLLLAHPALVPVFLTRPGLGPNAARLGELTFTLLRRAGVTGERAVHGFRVLLIFSLGFAAFQAPRLTDATRPRRAAATFDALPQDEFPEMRQISSQLSQHPGDDSFHLGLDWLLDGIASTTSAHGG